MAVANKSAKETKTSGAVGSRTGKNTADRKTANRSGGNTAGRSKKNQQNGKAAEGRKNLWRKSTNIRIIGHLKQELLFL